MKPAKTIALLLCCTLAASATEATEAPAPDVEAHGVGGIWLLDAERSDDARDEISDAVRDIAGDLGAPSASRRDATGLRRRAPRDALGREVFGPVRMPERSVELDVGEAAVDFRRDAGPAERVWTDGRPSVVDADNPDARTGAWEEGVLWVERISPHGTRVVEAWRREGAALFADYEIRNGLLEEPVTFTLVFTRTGSE